MSDEIESNRDSLSSTTSGVADLNLNQPTTTSKAGESKDKAKSKKVDILLNPTGNVPILKTRKWAVEPDKPVSSIIRFIHKYLKLDAEEKLFLYVNQTFAPSPDQTIKNLYDCYGTNGKLILYYCKSQAWG